MTDLEGGTAAGSGRIVVLHQPVITGDTTTWSLSLVDLAGAVVARNAVVESGVQALGELVQPSLDALGRRVDGDWISDLDAAGLPRHRARLL